MIRIIQAICLGGLLAAVFSTAVGAEGGGAKWLSAPSAKLQVAAPSPGYISFTFDDATLSQYKAAFQILTTADIPATLYVNTAVLDQQDPFFMSWDNVREMAAKGWEIGGHSVTHRSLLTLSVPEIFGELAFSNFRLRAELGETPRSFASPYGDYSEAIVTYIDYFYESHVRAWGDNGGINQAGVDPLLVERVNIDNSLTATEVCRMIRSVKDGQWMVLMFHQIGDASGPFISTQEQLQAVVACVSELITEKRIIADTVSAVVQRTQ